MTEQQLRESIWTEWFEDADGDYHVCAAMILKTTKRVSRHELRKFPDFRAQIEKDLKERIIRRLLHDRREEFRRQVIELQQAFDGLPVGNAQVLRVFDAMLELAKGL